MTRKKLSPGIHFVNIKGKDQKSHRRKVRVMKNGQWKFMKTPKSGSKGSKKSPSKKSGSKKSTKSKKPTKKKSGSTSGNSGGKKMKSRLNPINKNGIKVVTLGLLLALGGPLFDKGNANISPAGWIAKGDLGSAALSYWDRISGRKTRVPWKSLGVAAVAVGTGARVMDVKGMSFVQFS